MVPRYKKIWNPKNKQYPLRADGSLLCGPGCFSKANVLKKRFESRRQADSYLTERKIENQESYACEYCGGVHLTGIAMARRKKRKR